MSACLKRCVPFVVFVVLLLALPPEWALSYAGVEWCARARPAPGA